MEGLFVLEGEEDFILEREGDSSFWRGRKTAEGRKFVLEGGGGEARLFVLKGEEDFILEAGGGTVNASGVEVRILHTKVWLCPLGHLSRWA